MWKQLFAAIAGLGLSALAASAQNPANADPGFPIAPKGPPPAARSENPKPAQPMTALEADGFRDSIFAPPRSHHDSR